IMHAIALHRGLQEEALEVKAPPTAAKVTLANKFEERLLAEVVLPEEVGVTFSRIGALEAVKDTLKELVVLPLRRPELFTRGQLNFPHLPSPVSPSSLLNSSPNAENHISQIGALEAVKDTLKDLVMLLLRWPELFTCGLLTLHLSLLSLSPVPRCLTAEDHFSQQV
ncbi:unnamed protein product, partial [Closterium sp. NIES-54]